MEKQRKRHEHLISAVEDGSIAMEMGIEPGDKLLSINGQEIEDVFDYHYYVNDEELLVLDRGVDRGGAEGEGVGVPVDEGDVDGGDRADDVGLGQQYQAGRGENIPDAQPVDDSYDARRLEENRRKVEDKMSRQGLVPKVY